MPLQIAETSVAFRDLALYSCIPRTAVTLPDILSVTGFWRWNTQHELLHYGFSCFIHAVSPFSGLVTPLALWLHSPPTRFRFR